MVIDRSPGTGAHHPGTPTPPTPPVVTGSLTIFNPDGTPAAQGSELVGDYDPMEARLLDPAAVDGLFALDYNADYFKVTFDNAGQDVVTPDATTFTPDTGGTPLFVWGLKELDAGYDGTIDLLYEDSRSGGASAALSAGSAGGPTVAAAGTGGAKVATATDAPEELDIYWLNPFVDDSEEVVTNKTDPALLGQNVTLRVGEAGGTTSLG